MLLMKENNLEIFCKCNYLSSKNKAFW